MSNPLTTATETLLEPAGLGQRDIDALISRLMSNQVDYADLYFQHSQSESWLLENGAVTVSYTQQTLTTNREM